MNMLIKFVRDLKKSKSYLPSFSKKYVQFKKEKNTYFNLVAGRAQLANACCANRRGQCHQEAPEELALVVHLYPSTLILGHNHPTV